MKLSIVATCGHTLELITLMQPTKGNEHELLKTNIEYLELGML